MIKSSRAVICSLSSTPEARGTRALIWLPRLSWGSMQYTKLPNRVRYNHSKPGIHDSPLWCTQLCRNPATSIPGAIMIHPRLQDRNTLRRRASKDFDITDRTPTINLKSSITATQDITSENGKEGSLVLLSIIFNTSHRWWWQSP